MLAASFRENCRRFLCAVMNNVGGFGAALSDNRLQQVDNGVGVYGRPAAS